MNHQAVSERQSASEQRVRATFDQVAEGYDHRGAPWFEQTAEALVQSAKLQPYERALDVATGTGKVAIALARNTPEAEVLGADLSPGMLRVARQKADGLTNLKFELAAFSDLPNQRQYDLLTCSFGIFFVKDMPKTLNQLAQQVKPGGRLLLTTFIEGSFEPLSSAFFRLYSSFGNEVPVPAWLRVSSPQLVKTLFSEAALSVPTIEEHDFSFPITSAEHWWQIVYNAGYRRLLQELNPDEAASFKEQHLEEVRAILAGPRGSTLKLKVLISKLTLPE